MPFHPYYLKQYNNRWFVFGWMGRDDYLEHGFGRIRPFRQGKGKKPKQAKIDFTSTLEDVVVGVQPDGKNGQ